MVAALNRNPLKRALRLDKIRLAALEATLKLYRNPDALREQLPTLRSLTRPATEIAEQAEGLRPLAADALGPAFDVAVLRCRSQIGSGALPLDTIPSAGLAITPVDGRGHSLDALAAGLRELPVPVIGRVSEGRLVLDLRCLSGDEALVQALRSLRKAGTDA